MSDFNKGDFTQQGVDGHVRATLRLNEKRYVNLDLTTNENARGCTITGNVHDRLNNLDYPIGAAKTISSKTITENGTYNASEDDCDGYNPVTVNVQSGIPLENLQLTLLNNVTFTASESGGEIIAELTLDNYRAIPLGSNKTVLVKLDNADSVEYPVSMSLESGDFVIGDPTETPLYITGNMNDGFCYIALNDTNTHTITIKFSISGVPIVFECDGGDRISLRGDNYLFVMSCEEITPGHTLVKTYPAPISAGAGNKPRLFSWSVSGGPK